MAPCNVYSVDAVTIVRGTCSRRALTLRRRALEQHSSVNSNSLYNGSHKCFSMAIMPGPSPVSSLLSSIYHKNGRRVVENENGVIDVPLPSHAVCGMQLDVLHDSCSINRGLPPANSNCTTGAHLPAHEQHRRQASRCVHVGKVVEQDPHGQGVTNVHIADEILSRVQKQ